ncbi:MAG TPA: aldehyde dehydrogenase family protein [Mycobacteriales bacterium]|nr:aldehyde dehydrogenase family protein [Mycobacteriales bacterium]
MRTEGHFIGGEWRSGGDQFDVVNPYGGAVIARCALGTAADVDDAVAAARNAMATPLPAHERAALCERVAAVLRADVEGFAREICAEAGKPIRTARAEAERAVSTWTFAAVEARSLTGETVPMDASAAGAGKLAFTMTEPRGVVAAVTPFNFPLNLVAHKLAPALAAGCAVVLKPAEKTPLSSVRLIRAMLEAGLPAGWVNLVNGLGEDVVMPLVTHPDVAVVSFTGSTRVGHLIAEKAAGKHVLLELGSNAPLLVEPDADLDTVVAKVRATGFTHAGQSCISVQRLFVQREVYAELLDRLVPAVESLVIGDPADEATDVGPMIRPAETERITAWVAEAESAGAKVLTGGSADGDIFAPTVVADVTPEMRLCADEAFAPVVVVIPYGDLDEAIELANRSPFGLNAAVFTQRIDSALKAARGLKAGAVLVNESPTYRADQMPYGGVGESGNTREGPRYAVREMTQHKLVIVEAP